MKFTIERIEASCAVVELEDMSLIHLPLELIPSGAKEGDILQIAILTEETARRRREMEMKFEKLLKK